MWQDTPLPQMRRYVEGLRTLTPAQRLARVSSLTSGVRRLALAGLRQRHPEATEEELQVRLAALLYGRRIAARLGSVPDDAVESPDARRR